jgi:hypothetical protein
VAVPVRDRRHPERLDQPGGLRRQAESTHEIEKEAKDIKERVEQIDYFDLGGWRGK